MCKALATAQGHLVEIVALDGTTRGLLDRVEYSLSDPEASVIHLRGGCEFRPRAGTKHHRRPHSPASTATVALLDVVAVYDLTRWDRARIA